MPGTGNPFKSLHSKVKTDDDLFDEFLSMLTTIKLQLHSSFYIIHKQSGWLSLIWLLSSSFNGCQINNKTDNGMDKNCINIRGLKVNKSTIDCHREVQAHTNLYNFRKNLHCKVDDMNDFCGSKRKNKTDKTKYKYPIQHIGQKKNCYTLINDDNIRFLDEQSKTALRHSYPLFLFSYGGSGNTMTRLLLEYITNIWTGSIYRDPSLLKHGFKGENLKTYDDILVVKAHPEHVTNQPAFKEYGADFFLNKRLFWMAKNENDTKLSYTNMSAIFIVRNPWKAIFSLYTFNHGGCKCDEEKHLNGHTFHLWIDKWDREKWKKWVVSNANKYMKEFLIMEKMDEYGYDYIVVKYENLVNLENPSIQINEMKKMLKYLYSDDGYESNKEVLMERMKCLFPDLMKQDYQRLGDIHRPKANETKHVTMDMAYQWLVDNDHTDVICNAWDIMKDVATKYGYQNVLDVDCSDRD